MHVQELPAPQAPAPRATLLVRPWVDDVIDSVGHDPRSTYVERFWLGILGPSATWLVRHLVGRLELAPAGFALDLDECARAIGLGNRQGPNAAFPRTLARACQFGAAREAGDREMEVRRKLPPLTLRQVGRLPRALQAEHARWLDQAAPPAVEPEELRDRARRLALSLVELGEGLEATEMQLHRWRFHPALASEAATWAQRHHAARTPEAERALVPDRGPVATPCDERAVS